jgi:hypothetical protein
VRPEFLPANRRIVESLNPVPFLGIGRLVDRQGRPVDRAVFDDLSAQNLVHHAPLIVDLIRFVRTHRGNREKVEEIVDRDSGRLVALRLYTSIPELTGGVRGRAAMEVIGELRELTGKPLRFLLNAERGRRRAPKLTMGLVRMFTEGTTPMVIEIDPFLIALNEGYKLLPADLRERWRQFEGKRKPWHERAWAWAYAKRCEVERQSYPKLLRDWGIPSDPKHPDRAWDRFVSGWRFLKATGTLLGWQVVRMRGDVPDLIEFHFDTTVVRHLMRRERTAAAILGGRSGSGESGSGSGEPEPLESALGGHLRAAGE